MTPFNDERPSPVPQRHDAQEPSRFTDLIRNVRDTGPRTQRLNVECGNQRISILAWGDAAPEIVFLHGGSQNAHTWDRVMNELDVSAWAIDLPGHGSSSWREDHYYFPSMNAQTLAPVLDQVRDSVKLVVGMSLGGLTTVALNALRPDLVPRALLVDILPDQSSTPRQHPDRERIHALRADSSQRFARREDLVHHVTSVARNRDPESLAVGVVHNTVQDPDGWWRWRYDPDRISSEPDPQGNQRLWDSVAQLPEGSLLVRGALSTFVDDDAVQRLNKEAPQVRVETVPDAGHSVQGDQPRALAQLIRQLLEKS